MSLHKSLKRKDSLVRARNVLTMTERIESLKEDEKWEDGKTSVFALPKVKPVTVAVPTAKAKAPTAEEAEAAAEGEGGAQTEAAEGAGE